MSRTGLALRVLTVAGLLLTAWLAWTGWGGGSPAFCAQGSGCEVVQGSRWSRFLGLPIALWGFALYAALAWTAWRPGPRLQRWRRLWRLSFLGLAISVYLTVAGLVVLQAVCAWCLASLALMLAIFVLVHLARPDAAPGTPWPTWWLGNALLALGLLAVLQLSAMGLLERREEPRLRALAEHLSQSGAKFYGASWCPVCNEQKNAFGAAARHLPYVECSPNGRNGGVAFECLSAGVGGYPTWVIERQHHVEVLTPERLARLSGFDWEAAASQ
ncbi:vitamin K epoxide reductase family protein [Luteimonas sp. SDU101]|uniref:vitamin K epoxide reductase family protein n=1 Tax=unclassified Luteimonas TaxID=2629088 RepID=UPI003EB9D836